METRANYVLIGLFTLAVIVGAFSFVYWFSNNSGPGVRTAYRVVFQGPIADALTHVGQIAKMRRIAGAPIRSENYFQAEIAAGHGGPEQPKARVEWD